MARPTSPPRTGPRASSSEAPRGRSFQFFREVYGELRKVVWPSREEATRLTTLVLTIALAIGLALGLIDYLFNQLLGIVLF